MFSKYETPSSDNQTPEPSWLQPYHLLKAKMADEATPYRLTLDDLVFLFTILPQNSSEDIANQIFSWLEETALFIDDKEPDAVYLSSIALRILVVYKNLPQETLDTLCQLIKDESHTKELREQCFTALYLAACHVKREHVFLDYHLQLLEANFREEKPFSPNCRTKAAIGLLNRSADEALLRDALKYLESTFEDEDGLLSDKLIAIESILSHQKSLVLSDESLKYLVKLTENKTFLPLVLKIITFSEDNKKNSKTVAEESADKTLDQLLDELITKNKTLDRSKLLEDYEHIFTAYNDKSELFPDDQPISEWSKANCQAWAAALKTKPGKVLQPEFFFEMLAVIKRGHELATGQQLRIPQLLSLLLLLEGESLKEVGRLLQIATGEGKTTIIAMFAAFKALQGDFVDVVTSSPVLADTHANEKQKFLEHFNLTVGCNWDEKATQLEDGSKTCYSKNIVYGDVTTFEWDELRHAYEERNTRGTRKYQTVIVDEVDSLLIDAAANAAQLSTHTPAFEFLQPLLAACWQELTRLHQGFSIKEGKLYWQAGPDDEASEIPNRKAFLTSTLSDYLNHIVNKPLLFIPKHLKDFILTQTETWAKSAYLAFYEYDLDKEYTLAKNESGQIAIAPVDYETGVIHANSHWLDGLHRFLQLKHTKDGVKLSVESLISCYISNTAYFKKYKTLYGLTGTLGDFLEQQLLRDVYDVDFVFIPTYKTKHYQELEGVLAKNTADWLEQISANVLDKTKNRAILVICDSINAAKQIEQHLQSKGFEPSKIRLHTRTDNEKELHAVEQEITPGEVIIATNLAGRGTDIKTSADVEKAGGLHVCVSFLPENPRTEQQAVGRTSRQGKKGDARFIVNEEDVKRRGIATDDISSVEELKTKRDYLENQRLCKIIIDDVPKILLKDELFSKFSTLLKKLGSKKNTQDVYKLKQIEELWSVWLHHLLEEMYHETLIDCDKILASYSVFETQARQIFKDAVIQNPCYKVREGNDRHYEKNHSAALEAFNQAIELDAELAVHAYSGAALSIIQMRGPKYKQNARDYLIKERRIISEILIPQTQCISVLASFVPGTTEVPRVLSEQVNVRVDLLEEQIKYIDKAIYVLEHSSRDVVLKRYISLATVPSANGDADEIFKLNQAGLESFYEIEEVPPSKKKNSLLGALCVAFIGFCEVVVGTLCFISGNVVLGKALIKEGISDIIYAVRAAVSGNFDWEDYIEQKATRIGLDVALALADQIQMRAMGAKEASQQASLAQIRQENMAIAEQFVVKTVISQGVHELVDIAADCLIEKFIENFDGDLNDIIRSKLLAELNKPDVKQALEKLILAGKEAEIIAMAMALINPRRDRFSSVAQRIAEGVIARQSTATAVLIKLKNMGESVAKIHDLINDFGGDFANALMNAAKNLPTPSDSTDVKEKLDTVCNEIIGTVSNLITKGVEGQLHHGLAKPILNTMTHDHVEKWVQETLLAPKTTHMKNLALSSSLEQMANPSETKISADAPAEIIGEVSHAESTLQLPAGLMEKVVALSEIGAITTKKPVNAPEAHKNTEPLEKGGKKESLITGSNQIKEDHSSFNDDTTLPKNHSFFSPKLKQQAVGLKENSSGDLQFYKKENGQYTNLKKELSTSATQHDLMGNTDIKLLQKGEKGNGVYYVAILDPIKGKLLVEAELGKQYLFNIEAGSVDLKRLGTFDYFVDAGSVEALIKGAIHHNSTSVALSAQADIGVMGPLISGGLTENINIMGLSIKVQGIAGFGIGTKITAGASVGVDLAQFKANASLKFGLFKGIGASGKLNVEVGLDEQFSKVMEQSFCEAFSKDLIAQDVVKKIKAGETVQDWERDYLDDFTDKIAFQNTLKK